MIYLDNALGEHYISSMDAESSDQANALEMRLESLHQANVKPLAIISCANPTCKKPFRQKRYWQKFCSVTCRSSKYWSEHKRLTVTLTTQPKPIETT